MDLQLKMINVPSDTFWANLIWISWEGPSFRWHINKNIKSKCTNPGMNRMWGWRDHGVHLDKVSVLLSKRLRGHGAIQLVTPWFKQQNQKPFIYLLCSGLTCLRITSVQIQFSRVSKTFTQKFCIFQEKSYLLYFNLKVHKEKKNAF